MSTWKPIPEDRLRSLLECSEWAIESTATKLWNAIKLSQPEKWQQHPWGDDGDGFWVVAIYGHHCVYYNDIEEGFNIGHFSHWGKIDDYGGSQTELFDLVNSLASWFRA